MRYFLALVPLLVACGRGESDVAGAADAAGGAAAADAQRAIASTMERYMVHARAVRADSVAAYYTHDATLFEPGIFPIVTRDSIRAFMGSFPGVRVDSASAVSDTIEVLGDVALLWGTYYEQLSFPGQPQSEQDGKFVIQFRRQPNGEWLIHRYYRIPLPPRRPAGERPAAKPA